MKPALSEIRRAQPHLGTLVEISVSGCSREQAHMAIESAFSAIRQVGQLMSFHDPASDLSRLNREAAFYPVRVHAWTYRVLQAAQELHHHSGGLFDVTVAPVLQRLGLLPRDIDEKDVPNETHFAAVELLPDQAVRFHDPGIKMDLGGIAKGFAVDCAMDALKQGGVLQGMVNAGGDLYGFGNSRHEVHIRNPAHPGQMIAKVSLQNQALATSAHYFLDAENAGFRSCMIHPKTRKPVRKMESATVCAPSCLVADALTKIVMLVAEDSETILNRYGAHAFYVTTQGAVILSRSWRAALTLAA